MRYLTDYKRAAGLGSAHGGTHHLWHMQLSSAALILLVPLFLFTFGSILGSSHEEVLEYYSRPIPAVIAGLTLVVGLLHFNSGAQILIEDYSKGLTRQLLILLAAIFSYTSIALGLFALVKLALQG